MPEKISGLVKFFGMPIFSAKHTSILTQTHCIKLVVKEGEPWTILGWVPGSKTLFANGRYRKCSNLIVMLGHKLVLFWKGHYVIFSLEERVFQPFVSPPIDIRDEWTL